MGGLLRSDKGLGLIQAEKNHHCYTLAKELVTIDY